MREIASLRRLRPPDDLAEGKRSIVGNETECLVALRERRHTDVPAGSQRRKDSGALRWARNWDEVKYCSDACRRRS